MFARPSCVGHFAACCFDLTAQYLAVHALHACAERGLGGFARLHGLGRQRHQLMQSRHGICEVAFLAALTLRFDDDHAVSRDTLV